MKTKTFAEVWGRQIVRRWRLAARTVAGGGATRRRLWMALAGSVLVTIALTTLVVHFVLPAPAHATSLRPPGVVWQSPSDGKLREMGADGVPQLVGWGVGLAPGTHAVVAALSDGGRAIALHASDGNFYVIDEFNTVHVGRQMAPGSSPAIAAGANGSFKVAFQADTGWVWMYNSIDDTQTIKAATLPLGESLSIAFMPEYNQYVMSVRGTDGNWWLLFDNVSTGAFTVQQVSPPLPLRADSTPTIAAHNGQVVTLAVASDGQLWNYTALNVGTLTRSVYTVAAGTSPSITVLSNGIFAEAHVDANGALYAGGYYTALPVAPNTSPSIAPDGAGGWQAAFHDPSGQLRFYDSLLTLHNTHVLMMAGNETSPALAQALSSVPSLLSDPGIVAARLTAAQVQANGTSVTLSWIDQSTNEDTFRVVRRNATGALQSLQDIASTSASGTGSTYSFTDSITAGARVCYEIYDYNHLGAATYSNEKCTSPVTLPSAPATGSAVATTIDHSFGYNAVAVGTDGLGISAYFLTNGNNLRVAHCNNVACTSVTTHDLDTAGDTGENPSLVIGSDGLPVISYEQLADASNNLVADLKVAHCADVACSSATITTIDPAAKTSRSAIAIGQDGFPLILYADNSSFTADGNTSTRVTVMKLARCLNSACTSVNVRTIDAVGSNSDNVPNSSAVALAVSRNGVVSAAYWDGRETGPDDLRLATCLDGECAGSIFYTTVDAAGNEGFDPSLAIGADGLPLISYSGSASGSSARDLVVAHCLNVVCNTITRTVADSGSDGLKYASALAIGADGLGVISYSNLTTFNIKVAHCSNLDCTTVSTRSIDEFGQLGSLGSSITIGADGLPLIMYGDSENNLFKAVHCGDVACTIDLVMPF